MTAEPSEACLAFKWFKSMFTLAAEEDARGTDKIASQQVQRTRSPAEEKSRSLSLALNICGRG